MFLKDAKIQKTYIVIKMDLPFDLLRRLEALGMTKGAKIEVVYRKGKGILIIKLRGTRFALGENITSGIEVKEASDE